MRPNIENSIINSALWAASADALGWITELVDKKGVMRRTGKTKVMQTIPWKRKVGGIGGVTVELPKGTYSDDTQLRLAVCRSIQADGFFDVEAFAKVELSTWASYALGAGRGTKAAASNIARRDANWFSNFYSNGDQVYFQGGGNGAAMRVQPHVWCKPPGSDREYLLDVIKDSLVTHGHMRGVCGAVFHADCLAYALDTGIIPGPSEWSKFISRFSEIVNVIRTDYQLGKFWLSAWERASGTDLNTAVSQVAAEMMSYIPQIGDFRVSVEASYNKALESLECFTSKIGTGSNTALAAAYLAWVGQDQDIESTILIAVNALGSDTDTIATMVGALLGCISIDPPAWQVQDEEYIRAQAIRMARISEGKSCDNFQYPDLMTWRPPSSQSNALTIHNDKFFLQGFGALESSGKRWATGQFTWEWFRLPFGQTILCKYKSQQALHKSPRDSSTQDDPHGFIDRDKSMKKQSRGEPSERTEDIPNLELPLFTTRPNKLEVTSQESDFRPKELKASEPDSPTAHNAAKEVVDPSLVHDRKSSSQSSSGEDSPRTIAVLTDLVIKSNFNSEILGQCFLECVTGEFAIENAIAFSSILGKAIDVREKKSLSKKFSLK